MATETEHRERVDIAVGRWLDAAQAYRHDVEIDLKPETIVLARAARGHSTDRHWAPRRMLMAALRPEVRRDRFIVSVARATHERRGGNASMRFPRPPRARVLKTLLGAARIRRLDGTSPRRAP